MDLRLQEVVDYYTKLIKHENDEIQHPEVILPRVPEVSKDCTTLPSPHQYLLPSVILWDPLKQLSCFQNGMVCPFNGHNKENTCFLEPKRLRSGEHCWQAGFRSSLMPRLLCSSSWPAVLLSKIYVCKSKLQHKVYIGHDPEILSMIVSSESHKIPFVLCHKTGITKELVETVISLAASGMSLEDIEKLIIQTHKTNFLQCKTKFEEDKAVCLFNSGRTGVEEPVFPEYKSIGIPSLEMILVSFVDSYQEYKTYYHQRMSTLTAECLLLGHFFKISSQIGTTGPDGKKWVSLYDHIFIVMNEKGQVIAWQATKGTVIESTCQLLHNVNLRLKQRDINVKLILTPYCCLHKDFIRSIFGENVEVKMDPFFASHRLEKRFKIRPGDKDHVFTCLKEFSLAFQKETDLNAERMDETAPQDTIYENIHSFILQWKLVKGETNERLLHDPALHELENIKKCSANGCLSGIPANLGANYVSQLRMFLQPVFSKRFLRIDLAIPSIAVLLDCWNENHSKNETFLPICAYKDILDADTFTPTTEEFGILKVETERRDSNESTPLSQLTLLSLLWDANEECCLAESLLSNDMYCKVLLLAENSNIVYQSLKSMSAEKNLPIDVWNFHLLPNCIQIFSRNESQVEFINPGTLQDIAAMFGGTVISPDNQDTDGFFTALIHSLQSLIASMESENSAELCNLKEYLGLLGCSIEQLNNGTGIDIFRKLVCNEWLLNRHKYEKLLVSPLLDLGQEAELFTHTGYSQAEVTNLLPIAAARVLRLPLVIFTSMEYFPIVPIVCAFKPIVSKCLYMAYSTSGYGSYHTVHIASLPFKPTRACRCGLGRSKSMNRKFCVQITGQYLTRCDCFRNGEGCTHLCRCYNCSNPHGTSTDSRAMHTTQKTRQRPKHKLQKRRKNNLEFDSSWSNKEIFTLSHLIDAIQLVEGFALPMNPDIIAHEYQKLGQCEENPLKSKSLDYIKKNSSYVFCSTEKFKALFVKQMEKNWNCAVTSEDESLVVIVSNSE